MAEAERSLFIIRHAHRDTSNRLLDNGLSEKGRLQASAIEAHLKPLLTQTPLLFSSPKLRCKETLEPLANSLRLPLTIDSNLDERLLTESAQHFFDRIEAWAKRWQRSETPFTLLCSHGDWIPLFTQILLQQAIDLSKGGIIELRSIKGKAFLFDLRQ